MNYLEAIQKKWEELLSSKLKEQNGGSNETGGANEQLSPIEELDRFIKDQYAAAKLEKPTLADVPEYERMSTDFATDEQITERAKSELSDYQQQSKAAIDNEIAATEKKLAEDKASAQSGYESMEASLERIYSDAKEGASNDMLKRGLARSSISSSVVASLEKELGEKRSAALKSYIDGLTAIESEISGLEVKRQKALDDFNISYAAKLTEKINDLTKERDEGVKEALKYNNSLTEKEYEATVKKAKDESELYTEQLNQAAKEENLASISKTQQEEIYKSTYEKMDELLGGMSKAEAKKLLNSNDLFRTNLSDYYYYKLLDKYGR